MKKIKCQVCLEEEEGASYHAHLQDINNMKNEDGGRGLCSGQVYM
jgi:hypothetical protein